MSLIIKDLSYSHPNRDILFQNISFSVLPKQKIALIGSNGSGKSTLLRILSGELKASSGEIIAGEKPYYVAQHLGQYNDLTIAQVLGVADKLHALHQILDGNAETEYFSVLNDDWTIEERIAMALNYWDLDYLDIHQKMENLSGGEKTKVFLSGIFIHSPGIILLDEPTNHLDAKSRKKFYDWIENVSISLLVVSHDRTLLNLLSPTLELTKDRVEAYGGNFEFYKSEKDKKLNALQNQLLEKEKELRKAKKIARDTMERQAKHEVRGEKANLKKGIPRIAMGNLKNQSENTAANLKGIHEEKLTELSGNLTEIRSKLAQRNELKLNFENAKLHSGKILIDAKEINFAYPGKDFLWQQHRTFQIRSNERIGIRGDNGSGKTTLIRLITGQLSPSTGNMNRSDFQHIYIDQEYSIIRNELNVYEQIQEFNSRKLPEHEVKIILNRFLFPKETWDKSNIHLSGGEKMRLLLACMQVNNNIPDLFILDEPTNNLDIQSMEILTNTLKDYKGTIILISHDEYFIREIRIERFIS
ncbi:ATP-binding cassette domain-containing protein [Bacteroidales bacterium OttesenSCG-928-A17]|nr:ATP-binding cassette domain-containing protein [Bacteroidales bacterium OttesenSCG-928-A17]